MKEHNKFVLGFCYFSSILGFIFAGGILALYMGFILIQILVGMSAVTGILMSGTIWAAAYKRGFKDAQEEE